MKDNNVQTDSKYDLINNLCFLYDMNFAFLDIAANLCPGFSQSLAICEVNVYKCACTL